MFPTLSTALAQEAGSLVKISTFDKNFRPGYVQSFDFNLQHSFTPSLVWQFGYVGTKGTHLLGMFDINAGALGALNTAVPYNIHNVPGSLQRSDAHDPRQRSAVFASVLQPVPQLLGDRRGAQQPGLDL